MNFDASEGSDVRTAFGSERCAGNNRTPRGSGAHGASALDVWFCQVLKTPKTRCEDPRTFNDQAAVRVGISAPLGLTLLPWCLEFAAKHANQCKLFSNELR
jgi:hypothetical protein